MPRVERMASADFAKLLRQCATHIEENDSAGGFLEWEWSDEPDHFDVRGFVRYGNSVGQGFARVIGGTDA